MEKGIRYHCEKCGSTDVEVRAWVKPNKNNEFSQLYESSIEESDGYCPNCSDMEFVRLVPTEVEIQPENPWRCEECGSLNVETKQWVDSNSGRLCGNDSPDKGDLWCQDCEEHTNQVQESELLESIDNWFHNHLGPDDSEVISGLNFDDFPSEEAYDEACNEYWASLSNEQKIFIWKSLTCDKQ